MFVRSIISIITAMLALAGPVLAGTGSDFTVNTSADFYNRYVWRGLDIARTPSIQPSISISYTGFEFGIWGAYTLSNEASRADEIDFWLSYSRELGNGITSSVLLTDYYFPNAGIDFFNFNNYDARTPEGEPDPGAHTIEAGFSISGPESFPVIFSGYVNIHNDAGNNTYFQVDYPVTIGGTELALFCGAAGGSKDNPDYYGTDDFQAINIGVSASKQIEFSSTFSMPMSVSFVVNPNAEISYLLAGISF